MRWTGSSPHQFTRDDTQPAAQERQTANSVQAATRRYLQASLILLRSVPPSTETAKCLLSLAWVALETDCEDEAEACLRESVPLVAAVQDMLAEYQCVAGALALSHGDLNLAQRAFSVIQMIPEADPSVLAHSWEGLAIVAAWQGRREDAQSFVANAAACQAETRMNSPWWQRTLDAAMAGSAETSLPDSPSMPTQASPSCAPFSTDQVTELPANVDCTPLCCGMSSPQRTEPTLRERSVASLVARGMSNRQIARHLVVSERTVESHLANLRTKLSLQSRVQVAIWAAFRSCPYQLVADPPSSCGRARDDRATTLAAYAVQSPPLARCHETAT
jgi:DNA-binding CsgD family transcriptional regulator